MIEATLFTSFRYCQGNKPLIEILYDIRDGKYETTVSLHQAALKVGDRATADRIKRSLNAFTVSATYRNVRKETDITRYNPLLILDIDHQPVETIARLRATINESVYTVASFLSPGGQGLKIITWSAVNIELLPKNHRIIYNTVKVWYEQLLGVEIDASGSDVGRLCFVSSDPSLYISPRFDDWQDAGEALPDDLPLLPPRGQEAKLPKPARTAIGCLKRHVSNSTNRNGMRKATATTMSIVTLVSVTAWEYPSNGWQTIAGKTSPIFPPKKYSAQ